MQCKDFAALLEIDGLAPLPAPAQDHLAGCDHCQHFLADLHSIVAAAHQLPAELEPPARVWVNLRAELEAQGIVHEPAELVPAPASRWLGNLGGLFRVRALATAGVGLALALAAFLQLHKPAGVVRPGDAVANQVRPAGNNAANRTAEKSELPQQVVSPAPRAVAIAGRKALEAPGEAKPLPSVTLPSSTPTDDLYLAVPAGGLRQPGSEMQEAELAGNPAVDAALRKNLRTVNEFIAECEKHLKKHPQDTMAREYLNSALQQKAELISALLDSGRSEQ